MTNLLLPAKILTNIEEALDVPQGKRGLFWHLATLELCYELMDGDYNKGRENGEMLFMELADPAIKALRALGGATIWYEIQIWHRAAKNQIPQKQGFDHIVDWVHARGEEGLWYDGPLPSLNAQTIRAYLRAFEFWNLEWSLSIDELATIPFGKLRDCLSFARGLEDDEREDFMGFLRRHPRERIIAEWQLARRPPPPLESEAEILGDEIDLLSKEGALGPEPPAWLQAPPPSDRRRFYLDWDSGRLWVSEPGAHGTQIGIVGSFNRRFLSDAQLLVNYLKQEGVDAVVMNEKQVEDALLEFCKLADIQLS